VLVHEEIFIRGAPEAAQIRYSANLEANSTFGQHRKRMGASRGAIIAKT